MVKKTVPIAPPLSTGASGLCLTTTAHKHVKKMLVGQPNKNLRLSVKRAGCSGFTYVIDYVKDPNSDDLEFPIDNDLSVFVEQASFPLLKGICIDYVQSGLNGSLKFLNPNQTATCGCGESFSVEGSLKG
jgi:iron-sulfur cluster assembly accessory protein